MTVLAEKTSLTDKIVAYCAGDREAFTDIHNAYKDRLWSFLYAKSNNAQDAEDIFNITCLAVAENLNNLSEPQKLVSWVIGIASNRLSDYYRRKRAEMVDIDAMADHIQDPGDNGETHLLNQQRRQHLRMCIALLPDPQRKYFELQYLAGVPQKEIAAHFDLNINLLKSHVFRAKARVIDCMRKKGLLSEPSTTKSPAPLTVRRARPLISRA